MPVLVFGFQVTRVNFTATYTGRTSRRLRAIPCRRLLLSLSRPATGTDQRTARYDGLTTGWHPIEDGRVEPRWDGESHGGAHRACYRTDRRHELYPVHQPGNLAFLDGVTAGFASTCRPHMTRRSSLHGIIAWPPRPGIRKLKWLVPHSYTLLGTTPIYTTGALATTLHTHTAGAHSPYWSTTTLLELTRPTGAHPHCWSALALLEHTHTAGAVSEFTGSWVLVAEK